MTAEVGLKALIACYAQPGRVTWIGLWPERRAPVEAVAQTEVDALGLVGDHGASDKRPVMLVQAEHLPLIGAMLGRGPMEATTPRRNLLVAGLNLVAFKGRRVVVESAVLEITGLCAPFSRMEEALGPSGYSAVHGHGAGGVRE